MDEISSEFAQMLKETLNKMENKIEIKNVNDDSEEEILSQ